MELYTPQNTLTRGEALRLDELETTIDAGLKTFVDVGLALMEIRDSRLYRESYGTFEDYCQNRWGMVRRHANRLIVAAGVIENLGPIGPILPKTESQARPLAQLPDDMQAEAWRLAVDTAPNGKITAAHVQSVVDSFSEDDDVPDIWEDGCHNCKFLQTHGETWWCTELSRQTNVEFIACNMGLWKPEDAEPEPEPEKPHVSYNTGNNEWYTPAEYVDAARRVMGKIDLDPASSDAANEVIRASEYYTAEDNGLLYSWGGNVWMNPPYASDLVSKFCTKLAEHYELKDIFEAIVLVNNATETTWFNRLIASAAVVCFPRGRVKFWQPSGDLGAPLQGQAIIYFGENRTKFIDEYKRFGWIATVEA